MRRAKMVMLQTYDDDPCCSARLAVAIEKGELDSRVSWTCPRCGLSWEAATIEVVKHWAPRPAVAIWQNSKTP